MALLERRIGARWRQLSDGSANRRIFGAAVIVGGATAVVALAWMARELLVAASFGTSGALDAFLVAFSVPTFVGNVIAQSFASAVVPTFIRVREQEGHAAAQRVFSGLVLLATGFLLVAAALLALVIHLLLPLLASGFDPATLVLAERLSYLLLPTIVLRGLAAMWSSILNAGERFALAAFSPATVPLASVVALLASGAWGVYALAFGVIAGFALQLALLGWGLTRQGIGLWPRWHGLSPAIRQVIGQYLPVMAGAAFLGSTVLVDQAVAATLEPGSVATLGYGTKVVLLVVGLGAGALGTAVLPYFSTMVAVGDWGQVRQALRTYGRLTLLATIPLACLVFAFSEPIVELLFQRGAFTATDTSLVARVQALYALQIPFYVLGVLYVRLLSSLGANRVLMWSTAISFPLNAALDYGLARVLGVAGIALATTLMYVAAFCFLSVMLRRELGLAARRDAGKPG